MPTAKETSAIRTMAMLMSWLATGMHGAEWQTLLGQHGFTDATWQKHYTKLSARFASETELAETYAAAYQEECRRRFAEAAARAGRDLDSVHVAADWADVMQIEDKARTRLALTKEPEPGYRPNLDAIAAAVAQPSPATLERLLDDRSTVFVVDHREDILDIIGLVAARLPDQTLHLAGLSEDGAELGSGDRSEPIALTETPRDRYAMLLACNRVIGPDYEIRFCVDSAGSDSLVFVVLSAGDWSKVAHSALANRLAPLTDRDLFED